MAKRSKTAFGTIDNGIPDSLSIPDGSSPMLPPPLSGSAKRRGKKDPETKALQTSPAFDTGNFGLRDSLGGLQGGQSLDDTIDPGVLAELPSLSQTQTGDTAATQSMVPPPSKSTKFADFMFGPKSQRGIVDAGTVAVPGFGGISALEQQLQETLDGLNRGEKVGGLVAPDVPTLADSTAVDALGGDTAVDAPLRPPPQQNKFDTAVNGAPQNTPATGPGGTNVLDPAVAAKQITPPNNLPGGLAGSFRPPPKPMSEDYNVAAGNFNIGADRLNGMSNDQMYDGMGITAKTPPPQTQPQGEVTGAFGRPRPLDDISSADLMMPDMGKSIPDLGGGASSGVGGAGAEMGLPPVQPRPTLDRTALTMSPQSDAGAFQTGPEQYGHPNPPPEPPSASEANRLGDNNLHSLLKGYGKYRVAKAGAGLVAAGGTLGYNHYQNHKNDPKSRK